MALLYTVALLQGNSVVRRVTPVALRTRGEAERYLEVARSHGVVSGKRLAVVRIGR
jgi:hypothetical protein